VSGGGAKLHLQLVLMAPLKYHSTFFRSVADIAYKIVLSSSIEAEVESLSLSKTFYFSGSQVQF